MPEQILTGGCLCGSVRYETAAPVSDAAFCHCRSCRRATGAAAVPWTTVARSGLRWSGAPPAEFASSPGVTRSFCARCGTPLAYRSEASPGTLDLTLGSLDDPDAVAPLDHIWTEDSPRWGRPADGRPQHARMRPVATPT